MRIVSLVITTVLLLFFGCLFGAAVGAIAGAIVGFFFDSTMHLMAQALGIPDAAPYQLGAMIGFVGGFLRSSVDIKKA
jgi:hypothetical protein